MSESGTWTPKNSNLLNHRGWSEKAHVHRESIFSRSKSFGGRIFTDLLLPKRTSLAKLESRLTAFLSLPPTSHKGRKKNQIGLCWVRVSKNVSAWCITPWSLRPVFQVEEPFTNAWNLSNLKIGLWGFLQIKVRRLNIEFSSYNKAKILSVNIWCYELPYFHASFNN